jgi:predicted transposase YbfD/YdcC
MSTFDVFFAGVEDPRAANVSHSLSDIFVMMIAASLCGASNASEFALFAQSRKRLLRKLIDYDFAPSHDTFSRVLRLLDPKVFMQAFAVFAEAFAKALAKSGRKPSATVVAIDGKALRRAYERGRQACPPLTVSAFAAQSRLCLGVMPGAGTNEIEAAIKVVELLDLTRTIVTADALHCHHRMAEAITAKRGDYVLALKGNRHEWLAEAEQRFAVPGKRKIMQTTETSHGRNEWRKAEVVAAKPLMKGHAAFIRITTQTDESPPFVRHYMASKNLTAKAALNVTRAHWSIENGLHWILDVHLGEDLSRARKDHAPANIALLKRLVRNILQTADNPKVPISHRLKKCAWDETYLTHAITHMR